MPPHHLSLQISPHGTSYPSFWHPAIEQGLLCDNLIYGFTVQHHMLSFGPAT